jgi:hypothetical protein
MGKIFHEMGRTALYVVSLVVSSLMTAGYFGHEKSTNKSGPVQIKLECRTLASLHKRGSCFHLYL